MNANKKRVAWILYQLRLRGLSGMEIARRTGRTKGHVSQVMLGTRKDPKVREAIAQAIDVPVEIIWWEKEAHDHENHHPHGI